MEQLKDAIGRYCRVLSRCLEETNRAEDRDRYRRHLAEAAHWIGMAYGDSSPAKIVERIEGIQRAYGWEYLAGKPGETAEKAKAQLLDEVRAVGRDF